ncbi:MAG: hypothetical protein FJW39_03190 [Acidobacteria bacterium]|nr:hypothetical protein [Acidobacteriota bacterium]
MFRRAALITAIAFALYTPYVLSLPHFGWAGSKAEAKAKLDGRAEKFRQGLRADHFYIPSYGIHIAAWVAWIAFGYGERHRLAQAAAVGALLLTGTAVLSDYRENQLQHAVIDAASKGGESWASVSLTEVLTATRRKWGYLGLTLLLAGMANGAGMWIKGERRWGWRRVRTVACVVGGAAGTLGAAMVVPALFPAVAVGMAVAAVCVIAESRQDHVSC